MKRGEWSSSEEFWCDAAPFEPETRSPLPSAIAFGERISGAFVRDFAAAGGLLHIPINETSQ
jgi:hypothetical protein